MNPHKLELLKRIVKTFLFSMSLIVVAVSLGSPVGVIVLFFYAYLILFRPDEIQYLFNNCYLILFHTYIISFTFCPIASATTVHFVTKR